MTSQDVALVAPIENGMGGNQHALLEDADLVGERVHLDDAPSGGVGDTVERQWAERWLGLFEQFRGFR